MGGYGLSAMREEATKVLWLPLHRHPAVTVTPRRPAGPSEEAAKVRGQLLTRRLTLRPERQSRASRSGGPGQARSESATVAVTD